MEIQISYRIKLQNKKCPPGGARNVVSISIYYEKIDAGNLVKR